MVVESQTKSVPEGEKQRFRLSATKGNISVGEDAHISKPEYKDVPKGVRHQIRRRQHKIGLGATRALLL